MTNQGLPPYCIACGNRINIGDLYHSATGSGTRRHPTYTCKPCYEKPILIYQPKNRPRKIKRAYLQYPEKGKSITYKEYLKKYCNCKGVICE